jgi:PTS system nitrogen regulatory IIA component
MNIAELLGPDRVIRCSQIGSKKKLLEHVSGLLAQATQLLTPNEIFDSLVSREKLGSTGLGKGVALPHGRMSHLDRPVCAFIKLDEAVEFDAMDGKPVDLVFALLVPEESTEEHLQVLSTIAEMFSNPAFCIEMRNCDNDACLFGLLNRREAQQKSA